MNNTLNVLLVEDTPSDVALFTEMMNGAMCSVAESSLHF